MWKWHTHQDRTKLCTVWWRRLVYIYLYMCGVYCMIEKNDMKHRIHCHHTVQSFVSSLCVCYFHIWTEKKSYKVRIVCGPFWKKEINFLLSDYTITGFGWAEVRSCPRLTQGAAAGHHIIYYYYTTHTFLTWVEILFSIGSYLVEDFFFGSKFFFACCIIIIVIIIL